MLAEMCQQELRVAFRGCIFFAAAARGDRRS